MNMINTSECEFCTHSLLNEENKAKIMVYCRVKDKRYIYKLGEKTRHFSGEMNRHLENIHMR